MKKVIWSINIFLFIVAVLLNFVSLDKNVFSVDLDIKQVKSDYLNSHSDLEEDVSSNDFEEEKDFCDENNGSFTVLVEEVEKEEKTIEKEKVLLPIEVSSIEKEDVVLERQKGALSAYGPDCAGCSGYLASGRYVLDGNIYYDDSQYGTVRIVAGDKKYSYGTIVRIKSNKIGNEILAIVLDRGGIGLSKKFMFDLLFKSESEAWEFGSFSDVEFEILRYGY